MNEITPPSRRSVSAVFPRVLSRQGASKRFGDYLTEAAAPIADFEMPRLPRPNASDLLPLTAALNHMSAYAGAFAQVGHAVAETTAPFAKRERVR